MLPTVSSEARRRATYQDVLDAPENVVAEVIDGALYTQPRPKLGHARAASRLGMLLGGVFDVGARDAEGWTIVDEPELHLGPEPDILVPDIAAWRRSRFPNDPDLAFVDVAPDWVCEILSPSTTSKDRTLKLPIYAREAVNWAWLLDPSARVLECYELDAGSWRLLGSFPENARVRAPPFDAYELELGLLWQG